MSTRVFLVRHGESLWNAEGRLQGQADPPLSPRGVEQARALAEAFRARPLAASYTSPLARAHATATAIGAPHDLRPRVEAALREIHLGSWQGVKPATLHADMRASYQVWRVDPVAVTPPGGEAARAVLARVAPVLDAIVAAHPDATVVVVTHSIVGRVVLCHLLGAGLDLVPRLKLKQASIALMRLDGDGAGLERLGDLSHLDAIAPAGDAMGAGRRGGA